MMKRYRIMEEHNMRDLGKRLGVSASTWMRIEHGHVPDTATFMKLLNWMLSPDAGEGRSER